MKKNKLFWAMLALCAANFAAQLCVFPALPETVPMHWGMSGQADGWGAKWQVLILALLPFGIVLLMQVVRKIDPKHESFARFEKAWNIFTLLLTLFMIGMTWTSALDSFGLMPGGESMVSVLILGGCGVMFIVFGNFMPQIKQNYTFGCRTPWALNDEHNWNRTQRMGGITFVVMGAVMLLSSVFGKAMGDVVSMAVMLAAVFGGTIWIYVYSYLVYKGKMK